MPALLCELKKTNPSSLLTILAFSSVVRSLKTTKPKPALLIVAVPPRLKLLNSVTASPNPPLIVDGRVAGGAVVEEGRTGADDVVDRRVGGRRRLAEFDRAAGDVVDCHGAGSGRIAEGRHAAELIGDRCNARRVGIDDVENAAFVGDAAEDAGGVRGIAELQGRTDADRRCRRRIVLVPRSTTALLPRLSSPAFRAGRRPLIFPAIVSRPPLASRKPPAKPPRLIVLASLMLLFSVTSVPLVWMVPQSSVIAPVPSELTLVTCTVVARTADAAGVGIVAGEDGGAAKAAAAGKRQQARGRAAVCDISREGQDCQVVVDGTARRIDM